MKTFRFYITVMLSLLCYQELCTYPIDGYEITGIRRLLRLELIQRGEIKDTPPLPGALKSVADIQLHLADKGRQDSMETLPASDPELQKALDRLFPNLHESYSISLLDITPGKPLRYAKRQEDRGFQPGSVGKLAIVHALFYELQRLYPQSFEKRQELLRERKIRGGPWAVYDHHTVPFFDPETLKFFKRPVTEDDVFSLYEWVDHMLSVSNNGAASVVWKEALLMHVFGDEYVDLSEEKASEYFKKTPKDAIADIAIAVVNEPLRQIGIDHEEWRLGTFFTRGATAIIPGKGGSIGSPKGLMKWLVALERGVIVDYKSSLEIKRLMYMTDRRIRYGANASLKDAALYFKSGSLYSCDKNTMPDCGQYRGNVKNFMNSVAIIEHGDGTVYLVVLMTNVLEKNSNIDHNILAGNIDKIIRTT